MRKTGYADEIVIEDYIGQKIDDIQRYDVDIFAIGSDWKGKFDYLNEYCQVVYLPRTEGISSTMLREQSQHTMRVGIIGSGRMAKRFIPEAKVVNEETDALGRYFSFKTADVENASMDIFTGTVVLYKIYNNQSQMISDSFSINNYNEELSEKGYNRAYALGYQQLNVSNNDTPLVAKSGQNRTVEIRLFTEGYVNNPYEAGIKVSGQYIMDGNDYAIPLRENNTTFAFYSSSKNTVVNGFSYSNNIPNQEDIDSPDFSAVILLLCLMFF